MEEGVPTTLERGEEDTTPEVGVPTSLEGGNPGETGESEGCWWGWGGGGVTGNNLTEDNCSAFSVPYSVTDLEL